MDGFFVAKLKVEPRSTVKASLQKAEEADSKSSIKATREDADGGADAAGETSFFDDKEDNEIIERSLSKIKQKGKGRKSG
jgi:hypothetical protein